MKKYKECDKLLVVRDKSQLIGEFLDWLQDEKEYVICESTDDSIEHPYVPARLNCEELLAEFFRIDLKKVEKERRDMLNDLRKK